MNKFTILTSIGLPLNRANIDTDAIIPKQFLNQLNAQALGLTYLMNGVI